MRTISQRELRNDNAAIVRGVEAGESYTVTRRGVPVARLVPLAAETDLRVDRRARRRLRFRELERVRTGSPTDELLQDSRGER